MSQCNYCDAIILHPTSPANIDNGWQKITIKIKTSGQHELNLIACPLHGKEFKEDINNFLAKHRKGPLNVRCPKCSSSQVSQSINKFTCQQCSTSWQPMLTMEDKAKLEGF